MNAFKSAAKKVVIVLWSLLLLSAIALLIQSGVEIQDVPAHLEHWLKQFGLVEAALLYIIIYTLRPLVLFPATLLTILSGLLFGPWLGIILTIIGENMSANLAFLVSRYLGRDWVKSMESQQILKWEKRLQQNGLITVVIMRLLFLPFDAVNYGCGLTSLRHRDYALGTFLGILPSLIGFVLIGGALSSTTHQSLLILILSAVFLVLAISLAHFLKKSQPVEPT